jgi:hypothetical protein
MCACSEARGNARRQVRHECGLVVRPDGNRRSLAIGASRCLAISRSTCRRWFSVRQRSHLPPSGRRPPARSTLRTPTSPTVRHRTIDWRARRVRIHVSSVQHHHTRKIANEDSAAIALGASARSSRSRTRARTGPGHSRFSLGRKPEGRDFRSSVWRGRGSSRCLGGRRRGSPLAS